jgi:hypothetical protein
VREQIRNANYVVANVLTPSQSFKCFCECDNGSCHERVIVAREEYLSLHDSGTGYVVAPHHAERGAGRVVVRGGGYVVVRRADTVSA